MELSITGHRPDKLGGYIIPNFTYLKVRDWIKGQLVQLEPKVLYTGMALGVDQWAAELCIELGIPFIAVIPFAGQEKPWPEESKKHYYDLLVLAKTSIPVIVSPRYHPGVYQVRNEFLVNNCDLLLAVWDGSDGGTKNCVKYAEKMERAIIRCNPLEL